MTRQTGDLDAVRHMVAWVVRMVVESFSLFAAAAVFFLYTNWKLALCVLVISPFVFWIIYLFRNRVAPMHAALREKLAQMNTCAQENISGNRVVKAFAREDYEIEKFDRANTDYAETNKATGMVWLKFFPIVESIANLMPVVLLAVGGVFMIRGQLTMGDYVAFSGLIWAIANPMRQMGNIMNEFQRFSAASKKVMEIYYSEPKIKDALDAAAHTDHFKGKIEFREVSFQYEDGDLPVLHDISFTVKPGETIAIMGETGCGKTSLINLIPRFYEPTKGEVRIDDIPVQNFRLSDLRKQIGLATQDVLLYSDTIEGNIAYGDDSIKMNEVVKFARYSAAADFISKMPEGYDTLVGERGVGLSGGQKQRISLARALAIRPSVLILDDTTSAVDMETEKQIQQSLRELDFPCTKIVIAQRISTTKTADKIIVLQNGYIEEMMQGQKVVKVFCHEEKSIEEFKELNDKLFHSADNANKFANIAMPVNAQVGNISYVIVAIVGGILAINGIGSFTLGGLASFLTFNKSLNMPIGQVSQQVNFVAMALAGAQRIFELLDEEPEVDEGYVTLVNATEDADGTIHETDKHTGTWAWKHFHKEDGTTTYAKLLGDVEFLGVDFGYDEKKIVLHDIKMFATPGQKIAFVGSTGAGKTTITNLINRFYDIQDGKIRYDGININKIKKADLRHSLGMVLQDTHLFTASVKDNIRYGKLDATDEEVIEAAKLANADSFIERLPQGYDTVLTGDGANLSQGQRQLLSIARAAIADPPVLILDEATSSIDTRTEKIVQEGMDRLMHGRTTFVIAHRLSTIKNSDCIMVLEQGRIIERGSHDDLIEEQGRYYQLYTGNKA